MKFTTLSAEFSFDKIISKLINGMSMGTPFGPTMGKMFYFINKIYLFVLKQRSFFVRYIDATFCTFGSDIDTEVFHETLNALHPFVPGESGSNGVLFFLDV